jgi:hypothetical protein
MPETSSPGFRQLLDNIATSLEQQRGQSEYPLESDIPSGLFFTFFQGVKALHHGSLSVDASVQSSRTMQPNEIQTWKSDRTVASSFLRVIQK